MSDQSPTLHPGRRQLMRGAAWALPTIAIATAAPAFAASGCVPSIRYSGGLAYAWGVTGTPGTTTQVLQLRAGQVYVDNLPSYMTVTKIVTGITFQKRTSADPSLGTLSPGEVNTNFSSTGATTLNPPEHAVRLHESVDSRGLRLHHHYRPAVPVDKSRGFGL